jgi:hypothetical protein
LATYCSNFDIISEAIRPAYCINDHFRPYKD